MLFRSGPISPAAVFFGPIGRKEPALLVAQNNFARSMRLDPMGRWKVIDQFNASAASAQVTGVTALDVDGDGKAEIAMYDRGAREVVFLKEKDGLPRRWKQLEVGSFTLKGMTVGDFDSNGKDDLLLFDSNQMGIAYGGRQDSELRQIASYETDIRKGKLFDMAPGDLNADGKIGRAHV